MLDLEHAKELCEKATPGPMYSSEEIVFTDGNEVLSLYASGETVVGKHFVTFDSGKTHQQDCDDAAFYVFARTFIPAAIERIEKLEVVKWEAVRLTSDHVPFNTGDFDRLKNALREAEEEGMIMGSKLAKPEGAPK